MDALLLIPDKGKGWKKDAKDYCKGPRENEAEGFFVLHFGIYNQRIRIMDVPFNGIYGFDG